MAASCYNELMQSQHWVGKWLLQDLDNQPTVRDLNGAYDLDITLDGTPAAGISFADDGPTSYLPSSMDFRVGVHPGLFVSRINTDLAGAVSAGPYTILFWATQYDTGNARNAVALRAQNTGQFNRLCVNASGEVRHHLFEGVGGSPMSANFPHPSIPSDWHCYGYTADDQDYSIYVDGDHVGSATLAFSPNPTSNLDTFILGSNGNTNSQLDGFLAGVMAYSGVLTSGEHVEFAAGPEPVLAGFSPAIHAPDGAAVGDTLAVTDPGTWDLPAPFAGLSNGPLAYQYRWIRSGHGVISGATDATYTLTGDDYGHSVWAEVLGANDGGTDPSQWAASNAIAVEVIANVTLPTLQINPDGTWTGGLGTWSGNPTNYDWELRRAADGSVVDSGVTSDAGAVLSGSLFISGDYYLWVYAENSGGSLSAVSSTAVMQVGSQITFDAFRTSRRIMGDVRMGRRILGEVRVG